MILDEIADKTVERINKKKDVSFDEIKEKAELLKLVRFPFWKSFKIR